MDLILLNAIAGVFDLLPVLGAFDRKVVDSCEPSEANAQEI